MVSAAAFSLIQSGQRSVELFRSSVHSEPVAVGLLPLEAMLLIKIARRGILPGRQKPALQPLASALGRAFGEMREKRGFNCPSDDAAAQQEGIHFALFAYVVRDRDPDQSVIAETVAHPDRKYVATRARFAMSAICGSV